MEFILLVKYFKVKGKGLWRHDIVPLEFLLSRGTVYIICFPQPIYIQNQVPRSTFSKLICCVLFTLCILHPTPLCNVSSLIGCDVFV